MHTLSSTMVGRDAETAPATHAELWLSVRTSGMQWQVLASWKESFLGEQGLRLEEWRRQGRLTVAKQNAQRTVYRLDLAEGEIYLKHFPSDGFRSRFRQVFQPSKARLEMKNAVGVAARGVRTVEPIAIGETPFGDSYLATIGISDAEPLMSFIEKRLSAMPAERRNVLRFRIAAAVAEFIAQMHEQGIDHKDLHAGNILIQLDAHDRPRLFLIDLQEVRLRKPLSWRKSRAGLVMFNRWCSRHTSRTDRRRFLRFYMQRRQSWQISPCAEQKRAKEIEERTLAACLGYWLTRDGVYLGTNRRYYRCAVGNHRAFAMRELASSDLKAILADPEAVLARPDCRILKKSPSSLVGEFTLPVNGVPTSVIFKRFALTKWSDPWVSLFRPDPALRSWLNGCRLLLADLPTARPLAVVQRRRWGFVQESYLLTQKIEGACDLRSFILSLAALAAQERQTIIRVLIDQLAHLVRNVHNRGFSQRDLKAANILVPQTPEDTASSHVELILIDLVGVELRRRIPRSRRVQNLARLHASFMEQPWLTRANKLRFLRAYLAWGLEGKAGWKEWWRDISEATMKKVIQNRNRGRVLR